MRLEGYRAIEFARLHGFTVNKYADPIEGPRANIGISAALDIAREDPSLLWLDIEDELVFRDLRAEAGEAGDLEQVALCDRALAGDAAARRECVEVIENAAAQADSRGSRSRPASRIPARTAAPGQSRILSQRATRDIGEIWAVVVRDPATGKEGVVRRVTPAGTQPMTADDERVARVLLDNARALNLDVPAGTKPYLVKFTRAISTEGL